MLHLSRFLRHSVATGTPKNAAAVLAAVASRLPPKGLSSSHLHALVEDDFPLFTPSSAGALSLLEAVQMHPELFTVTVGGPDKWVVQRAGAALDSSETVSGQVSPMPSPSSTTAPTPQSTDVYQRLSAHLHAQAATGSHDGGFVSLESALQAIGCDDALDVVDQLTTTTTTGDLLPQDVETDLSLHVKLLRAPRASTVFVDGSELPATAVNDMCEELRLIKERSTVCIVRHPHHTALSAVDVVIPDSVPLYLLIEKAARRLARRSPLVLQDVVYMCSARQFSAYAQRVALMNEFPDADVYVCCPSRLQLVQRKVLIPLSSSHAQ